MKIFTNVVVPVLAVVTPLLVGYLTWSIDQAQTRISREIAALDGQIKRQEQSRKERESIQAYNMQVLEEVKTALKRDDEVYQKVVIGLLSSMPNKELAQAWLGALAQSEFTSIEN